MYNVQKSRPSSNLGVKGPTTYRAPTLQKSTTPVENQRMLRSFFNPLMHKVAKMVT